MKTDIRTLPRLEYMQLQDPEAAHRVIACARNEAPIAIGALGPELLTHDLVGAMLRDTRFAVAGRAAVEAQGLTAGPLWHRISNLMLNIDGDAHQRLRRLVARAFTPRATARLESLITQIITELVDSVTTVGRCDVVADIAERFPIPIICALLGAPREDWKLFSQWTNDIKKWLDWNLVDDAPAILTAWQAQDAYMADMIARRRDALTDDLISELIRAEQDGDKLDHEELLLLTAMLLGAGTDTTRNQLAAAVDVFCDHPEQWELLGHHPELASGAVDEVMRYRPIALAIPRVATEDVEIAGVLFEAGTIVFANLAAANRDPAVFDEPDSFDITRREPGPTLNFGGGSHYCLGSHLARLELTRALTVMSVRMPNLQRTGPAPWPSMAGVIGPRTVPIAFG
jgi:cytochrome P450